MVPDAQASGSLLNVFSPHDGALLAELETIGGSGAEQALTTADRVFKDRANWLTAERRIQILNNAAALMARDAVRLTAIASREGGKPLIDSRIEMARAIDGIKLCAQCIRTRHGEEIPMGINAASMNRLAVTQHEPIGVVLAFSAFNHPINLIVHQIGPAIAAGCPVIVKPANDTPMSCYELIKLFHEAGLPPEWCQVISTTGHDVSEALVADPRIAFFSFIGSADVGWMLRSKLAPGTRCALEHGGVAPVILAPDADVDSAIPLLAKGGFYHAGQVCISVQRVYAPGSMAREVAMGLAAAGQAMTVGDPCLDTTDIGPMIRHGELDRVHQAVENAVNSGAELICGGQKTSPSHYYPTVLLDPPADADVSCKEIFGPVICVYSYDELDDAIASANALEFAFQAAIFTRNIDTALYGYRQLNASAVMVNDHSAFRVDWMPFAGLRHSGHGVGGIPDTFADMQIKKMLVLKSLSL
ncbi:MAG: aldehyde dehydrogenase family protein [Gammaproteobacteria bacterium]|nr:aldehyde dehydrogenase family protein [Gammaproteobacteria bacterium]MBQ0839948.1 aldehyde dehydrogenase family protein [Gammaproteobacteria bacterium]